MKAIVAVDINWGIGYQGNLLQRIPEDMKYFKQITLGKVVIMGRETFDSLPGKVPLKDRVNIVLTRNQDFCVNGLVVCHSLEGLQQELEKHNTDDVFVIGGESIYLQLLPFCDEAYVTKIEKAYTADKYFVKLDEDDTWKIENISEAKSYNDVQFYFTKYVKATY